MDDFANLLQRDYGLKPQGKSAPMSSSRAGAPYLPAKAGGSQGRSLNRGNSGSAGLPTRTSSLHAEDGLGDDIFFGSTNLSNKSGKNAYNMADSGFGYSKSSFDDVFGDSLSFGVSKQPSKSSAPAYDEIFSTPIMSSTSNSPSFPVFDMPKYDDDIFVGVPGIKRNSASAPYEDVFGMGASRADVSNDLLKGFAVSEPSRSNPEVEHFLDASSSGLEDLESDELLPGFGSSEQFKPTSTADAKPSQAPIDNPIFSVGGSASMSMEMDPFSGLNSDLIGRGNSSYATASTFVDPLDDPFEMQIHQKPDTADFNLKPKENAKNTVVNDVFDGIFQSKASEFANVHSRLSKATTTKDDVAIPPVASNLNTSLPEAESVYNTATNHKVDHFPLSPPKEESNKYFSNSEPALVNLKKKSVRFDEPVMKSEVSEFSETFTPPDSSQSTIKEVWVTIDDIRLVTKPTNALPPSRPAPRFDLKKTSAMRKSEFKTNTIDDSGVVQDFLNETSSRVPTYRTSSIEDLENFVSGGFHPEGNDEEQSPAAKLKEASERVERRLKTAREGREKDQEEKDSEAKATKLKEEREKREKEARIIQERETKEKEAKEERERQRRELEREREKDRAAVDRATHEARERAAEKALAEARERAERAAAEARQRAERVAVERVTAEARERAAAEAREKAAAEAREKAATEAREQAAAEARERAAAEAKQRAERAAAEARQRAERAAVERVTAEARERAAAEAREKAATEAREQAAAEARERAAAEAKQRAERAAVERATAEARGRAERAAVERVNAEARERAAERAAIEKAAAEVRERAEKAAERAAVQRAAAEVRERAEKAAAQRAASAAAAAARDQQQRSEDNDLEQFFNMSSRAASAPKQRPSTSESVPEHKGKSPTTAPTVRKVSSTTNIVDDWTTLFATPSTAEFQEIEGEAPERRKARWERHQRTLERSAKALAEKNQRDLDAQREQAEKHRAADTLDAEIRRWAAGKEGNLRALLSTLQYVLWPECGWQPVSLTDLIAGASVKKVYRKATLYVHPDKVQQKGATVQQKYVAEKVFDLLKEAWNKFNSEELF